MRFGTIAATLALGAALAACESTNSPPASDTFKVNLSRGDNNAETYAKYLSARFAATEHDLHGAAKFYRASLDRDPTNPTLLALAFFYSTSAGQIDDAAKLAERLTRNTADDRAARLTLAVVALRSHDFKAARANLALSAKGPFTNLTTAVVDAWAAAGSGDGAAALADLKAMSTMNGADALIALHTALLNEFLGRNAEADSAYHDALQKVGASPRVVEAYGRFLERNGRVQEASALYAKLASDVTLAPLIAARQADVASGRKPDPLVARAQDGAAEALFGIAGSLTDQSSVDISILYLRLALCLRPDLALADVLLADRLEALQKYEDAITLYRAIDRNSP